MYTYTHIHTYKYIYIHQRERYIHIFTNTQDKKNTYAGHFMTFVHNKKKSKQQLEAQQKSAQLDGVGAARVSKRKYHLCV